MLVPSDEGQIEARRQVDVFVQDLLIEGSRIAERRESEKVSPKHISEAAAHIYVNRNSRLNQILSGVGGVTVGSASAALVTFIFTEPIKAMGVFWSAVVTLIGAIVLTIGLVRG